MKPRTQRFIDTLIDRRGDDGFAAVLLRAGGVGSDVVTGGSDRETQIEAFRAGRLDVLVNCIVLGEGFDCPELRTVFCRPSCKGMTVQMCGRVLRKHPALAFKQIVQCRNTRWPFGRTTAAALQHAWVDGAARTLEAGPRVEDASRCVRGALARIPVEMPKYLLDRQVRRPPRRAVGPVYRTEPT